MTFLHQGKQYIVFATGSGANTALDRADAANSRGGQVKAEEHESSRRKGRRSSGLLPFVAFCLHSSFRGYDRGPLMADFEKCPGGCGGPRGVVRVACCAASARPHVPRSSRAIRRRASSASPCSRTGSLSGRSCRGPKPASAPSRRNRSSIRPTARTARTDASRQERARRTQGAARQRQGERRAAGRDDRRAGPRGRLDRREGYPGRRASWSARTSRSRPT